MVNELIFLAHVGIISASVLGALMLGAPALNALIVLQAVLANLFVAKQTVLFGLLVTCTDAFAVGCGLTLNIIQEYYGRPAARRAIIISFAGLVFFMVMAVFQQWYAPAFQDIFHAHWRILLCATPRIVLASGIAYVCAQFTDYYVYQYAQARRLPFIWRNYSSLIISQLIDTVLFSVIGLWGIVDALAQVIIFSYAIKLITIIIATPLVSFARRFIQQPH